MSKINFIISYCKCKYKTATRARVQSIVVNTKYIKDTFNNISNNILDI